MHPDTVKGMNNTMASTGTNHVPSNRDNAVCIVHVDMTPNVTRRSTDLEVAFNLNISKNTIS